MNFNENDLLREKTELLYLRLRLSKLERAKVLIKLEFDTEDQVLLLHIWSYVLTIFEEMFTQHLKICVTKFENICKQGIWIFNTAGKLQFW